MKDPVPFTLTAAPVQQGLFLPSKYERKPKPPAPSLSDDERQGDMFTEAGHGDEEG